MNDLKKHVDDAKSFNIKLTVLCAILIVVIFSIDVQIPLGVAGGVPYIAVILVSLWSTKRSFVMYLAVICSFMTILGFYVSPSGGELWQVLLNRALALFAIWITAILALQWKVHEEKISYLDCEKEREKEKIYLATIYSAQHITNNLLNQIKIVEFEIDKHSTFDKEVISMFNEMLVEASTLMQSLSTVDTIEDDAIRKSVWKKPNT